MLSGMSSRRGPLLALTLTFVAPSCSPDVPVGERPDARPGTDAALAQDAGPDATMVWDAFVEVDASAGDDAFVEADASDVLDAFVEPDAFVPRDAFVVSDAFVGSDGGSDGGSVLTDAGRTWTVGFCRIQAPTMVTQAVGATTQIYGRVYVAGLTDRTGTNDTDPAVRAELGVGPDGTLPNTDGWSWVAATPNPGYGPGSPAHEPNNDEYQAGLTRASPGTYDFAFRFSGDGGSSWVYCDAMGPGSSDGYDVANAGSLTVM
ncbi:MAG: hypothetical protein OHK0013_09630 [Sandaracinaceae bacterium]